MGYNGGTVVAMSGKNCVAMATDLRFGIQNQTVGTEFQKVFREGEKTMIGMTGLATDSQTVYQRVRMKANIYRLREEREMKPQVVASMVSSLLYEHRFGPYFVEPVVAGLTTGGAREGEENKPFLCGMDLLGAPMFAEDFVGAGTSIDGIMGVCESLWKPDLEPEDLFEVISQCLLSAVDRDAFSGWGAVVHVLTPTHFTTHFLKSRQD